MNRRTVVRGVVVLFGLGALAYVLDVLPIAPGGITPGVGGDTFLAGQVFLGPTCPVETTPPDPSCAGKTYQTTVEIRRSGESSVVARANTNSEGEFKVAIPAGTYDVQAIGGETLPFCKPQMIVVEANTSTWIDLSCDTGIR